MYDYLKMIWRFIKINFSLILSYIIVTIFIISMSFNYIQNDKLKKISRGFLSRDSLEVKINNVYDDDLESIIKEILPSEGIIIKKEPLNSKFIAEINRIYLKQGFKSPTVSDGRFLTEEESFSNKKIAVVGKGLTDFIEEKDGKSFILINNIQYEVIGICGEKYESKLDSMIYIPMGTGTDYKINGTIIIDQVSNVEIFMQRVKEESQDRISLEKVEEGKIVQGSIDPVTGEVTEVILSNNDLDSSALSFYIYGITVISAVLCIISISMNWYDKNKKEIYVCKVLGFYKKEIFVRIMKKYCTIAILGSVIGIGIAIFILIIL